MQGFIRSKNRARLNYTLAVNNLADLTPEEFRAMNDLLYDEDNRVPEFMKDQFPSHDDVPVVNYTEPSEPLPENLDWREYGVISPTRGQSMCGSCWAFSTAGILEGAYKIATGKDIEFSAQMLVDCTYGFNNYGCRGGWPWKAMQWVIRNGIATHESYGRYLAQEGLCHCGTADNCTVHHPTSFGDVLKANRTAMKVNLATYGPVSVGINSAPKSFKFYRDGVYDDFDCDDATQHSLILVGYGKQAYGPNYWIIKNSWGPFWGQKGYMRISNDFDTCGILSSNGVIASFRNTSHGFPFERMKKVVTPYHANIEDKIAKDKFKPVFNSIPFQ
ncbi:cathepsin L1-like [Dendronephthya gigantea]|uniref:cathepsin L1-like n=1 Tax=Dendronephthya gigantea TaxID=151771 RepID=UPI00106C11ED|nr:cathepsin L1-like [Dendronephthya gigantea]